MHATVAMWLDQSHVSLFPSMYTMKSFTLRERERERVCMCSEERERERKLRQFLCVYAYSRE